jgi:CheY-specific phosphatase CheX
MFFVFLEPLDEDVRYDMLTTIHFSGPMKGEIKAYLSKGIASLMVQNMLGMEPWEVTDKTMEDCAKEALNMIAGSFLNKLEPKKVFDLSIPDYEKKTGNYSKNPDQALSLIFDSDDHRMGIAMNIETQK